MDDMKWSLPIIVAALTGCSPTAPSAWDAQIALENYYQQHVYRGDDWYSVIVRCATISEFEGSRSDGETAGVRLRFEGDRRIFEFGLKSARSGRWHIPREAKLAELPCKVFKVRGIVQTS